jgi:hypothetical protein
VSEIPSSENHQLTLADLPRLIRTMPNRITSGMPTFQELAQENRTE